MPSNDEQQDADRNHSEGTISPAELEERNGQRGLAGGPTYQFEANGSSEINFHADGGYEKSGRIEEFSSLLDQHFSKMLVLLFGFILLVGLLIVALFLWQIHSLHPLIDQLDQSIQSAQIFSLLS